MSAFEHLFLDPGHDDVERTAHDLVVGLAMNLNRDRSGDLFVWTEQLPPDAGHVGGKVARNDYQMVDPVLPEHFSIYDDLPIMWSLRTDGIWDGELRAAEQRRLARIVFDLVVERLGWPAILVHDFEDLVATYDPERGVREFPPGTLADGRHRHLWA